MKFSVAFSCSSAGLVSWSPNGRYLAVPDNNKLYIKDGQTAYCLLTSYTCRDAIKLVQWSPDSSLVMTATLSSSSSATSSAAVIENNCIEVWNIHDPDWRCCIQQGSAGLAAVIWSPDSRHIITADLFYLKVCVWSLVTRSSVFMHSAKQCCGSASLQFSEDGQYLAIADRNNFKDSLVLAETRTWQLATQFTTDTTDLHGFAWGCGGESGPGVVLAVWDCPLYYTLNLYTMCGRLLRSIKGAEEFSLGVRGACWTPSGQHLVIGDHNDTVRLVSYISWEETCRRQLSHLINDESDAGDCVQRVRIYKEVSKKVSSGSLASLTDRETAYCEERHRPVQLSPSPATSFTVTSCSAAASAPWRLVSGGFRYRGSVLGVMCPLDQGVADTTSSHGCGGVTSMLFSSDGRYLATTAHSHPSVVWLWTMPKLALVAVLVHNSPIKDLSWSPRHTRLAVCTGDDTLFLWTSFGSLTVATPYALRLQPIAIRWHPSGSHLMLVGRGGQQFTVCSVAHGLSNAGNDITAN